MGVVVGLAAEARLARRLGWPVAIGGGTAEGARAAALRLVASGCSGLLSFGLAGGLDPSLAAGSIVLPARVLPGGWAVSRDLAGRFGAAAGDLLASDAVLAGVADKRAAFLATGATAVDLESGAVAEQAARSGVPFAVLRAVCDPAWRDLPPAALVALHGAGRIGLGAVLASVARSPAQVPALLRLARDAAAARAALAAVIGG